MWDCTLPDELAVVVIKGLTPEPGGSLAFSEKSAVALQFLLDELKLLIAFILIWRYI